MIDGHVDHFQGMQLKAAMCGPKWQMLHGSHKIPRQL